MNGSSVSFSNVRIQSLEDDPWEDRCLLDTCDERNDVNNETQKYGIRCHSAITALFFSFLGLFSTTFSKKIKRIKTVEGEVIYLNRNSYNKWRKRHSARLRPEIEKIAGLRSFFSGGLSKIKLHKIVEFYRIQSDAEEGLRRKIEEGWCDLAVNGVKLLVPPEVKEILKAISCAEELENIIQLIQEGKNAEVARKLGISAAAAGAIYVLGPIAATALTARSIGNFLFNAGKSVVDTACYYFHSSYHDPFRHAYILKEYQTRYSQFVRPAIEV